jgi:lipoprotein-anchoring transpeptidase ErfK/SrfK
MKNESGDDRRSPAMLRAVLMSGLTTALIAGLSEPAAAYPMFGDQWAPSPQVNQSAPTYRRKRVYQRRWQQQPTQPSKANAQVAPEKPQNPLTLVISIRSQKVSLYGNGKLIETSIISTGTPGHDTPMGVFSVIEKDRHHRSNIYSAAPMPYMQRITWSGVALHEGFVTGRPASHGCIRLPHAFAAKLWDLTQLGVRVIIAPEDVTPVSISHDRLFAMKPKPALPPVAALEPDPVPTAKIRLATNAERTDTATVPEMDVQPVPAVPEVSAEADPLAEGRALTDLIRAEQQPRQAVGEPVKEQVKDQVKDAAKPVTAEPEPTVTVGKPGNLDKLKLATTGKEYPSRPGAITVFISRSLGKLYVRKGFWPVFETPVKIAQPDVPFGTHVFTALEPKSDTELRWNVVSLPNEIKKAPGQALTPAQRRLGIVAAVREHVHPANPADVLNRISIPDEALNRISELMTPGASLVISDMGISHETNRGTDFVILTK